jgi:hypothetical protein
MLGNSFGRGGMIFVAPFAIGLLLSTLAIILIHHPAIQQTSTNPFIHLATETGYIPAMTLTLASRLGLVLLLPTGMLVTAGFTFNETFVYWFPNFGFSFLLLGIILVLHLVGDRLALAVQPFFIGLTICCLLLLCLAGLFGPQQFQTPSTETNRTFSLFIPLATTSLLLFMGYDRQNFPAAPDDREYYIWTIAAGFVLLILWGFVSLKHVPGAKLADSTIPYTLSAREILGQPGRVIMGIAVISGTCGVVNGLYLMAVRSLQQMADHFSLPFFIHPAVKQKIWPVMFSLTITMFLAFGLAGTEYLETYIFGVLLLWLLMIGTECFAAARTLRRQKAGYAASWYLLSIVFPLAAVWLACTYVHAATLVVFCCFVLGISATISTGWAWYCREPDNKIIQDSQGDIS